MRLRTYVCANLEKYETLDRLKKKIIVQWIIRSIKNTSDGFLELDPKSKHGDFIEVDFDGHHMVRFSKKRREEEWTKRDRSLAGRRALDLL